MNADKTLALSRARAALRCMAREDILDPDPTSRASYHQCMCGAGITSHCSISSTNSPYGVKPTEESMSIPFDGSLFEDGRSASENDWEVDADGHWLPRVNVEGGALWLGILVALVLFICLSFRCYGGEEEPSSCSGGSRRSRSNRSGGAAAAASTTNDVTPGGGGGGGQGETAAPVDLPPPYDLVYEENITPPTYEEVIREEAKDGDRDPV